MPKFVFKKLIRDNILEEHLKVGHDIQYRLLTGNELKEALRVKLHEEADEIPIRDEADREIIEEIADVQQIIDDLKSLYGLDGSTVTEAQKKKHDKKGGFKRGVYVDTVDVPEGDEWIPYYRRSPEKYPEVLPATEHFDVPYIEPGVYQHYKGNNYEVLFVGCDTETHEYSVVYKALYEKEDVPAIWIRPYDMFVGSVDSDEGKVDRFKKTK